MRVIVFIQIRENNKNNNKNERSKLAKYKVPRFNLLVLGPMNFATPSFIQQ